MKLFNAIRERLSKATQGPWALNKRYEKSYSVWSRSEQEGLAICSFQNVKRSDVEKEGNANFIAHAPQDIEDLLKALDLAVKELNWHAATGEHTAKAALAKIEELSKRSEG